MSNGSAEFLAHYGVKGMKWGHHKEKPSNTHRELKPNSDGSIDIPKGSVIQRVVNGKRLLANAGVDVGDKYTYASFTKGDNLRYESNFGVHKNLLVKDASQVLSLTTKEHLKAPTPGETSSLFYKHLTANPEELKAAQQHLKKSVLGDPKALDRALIKPDTKEAYNLFGLLFDTSNYNHKLGSINDGFIKSLQKAGYNTILDPSDSVWNGMYDAPIVVFGGKKSLEVTGVRVVTKESRKLVSEVLKEHEKIDSGKRLMQQLGYDDA